MDTLMRNAADDRRADCLMPCRVRTSPHRLAQARCKHLPVLAPSLRELRRAMDAPERVVYSLPDLMSNKLQLVVVSRLLHCCFKESPSPGQRQTEVYRTSGRMIKCA